MTESGQNRSWVTRRGFIGVAGGAVGSVGVMAAGLAGQALAGPADVPAAGASDPAPRHPRGAHDALRLLMDGNRRWACGRPEHPHQSVARRHHVASHQDPFATVISCIDSRVPPEIVFDRGIGDLFVVRTGAQTLDDRVVLGSIEFGPNGYPSARLMFVLGHQQCGAVSAAISAIQTGERAPGHIQAVVNALRPAYRAAIGRSGDLLDNMIRAQVKLTVRRLRNDPLISEQIEHHGLLVVGGRYDLDSGRVGIIAA